MSRTGLASRVSRLAFCLLLTAASARAAACLDQAIQQLVAQLEDGAPEETINGIAVWLWLDEKLPEGVRRHFRDDLEIALINSPRFQYFNRDRFRQLLREHQLTIAQLADPANMRAFAAAGIDGFLSIEVLDTSFAHPEFKEPDTYCVVLAKLTEAQTASIAWANFIEGANPVALRTLLHDVKAVKGTTRYRQLATAIAESLRKANPLKPPPEAPAGAEPDPAAAPAPEAEGKQELYTITLSSPAPDGSAGIGIQNPINAPFDLKAFQDELLVAISKTGNHAYVDPTHVARLIDAWTRDSEATATANKKTLAEAFALDGYLFGEIRSTTPGAVELSMRLTSLRDGSEAWAGKFHGADSYLRIEPKPLPEPPVPRDEPKAPTPLTLDDIERPLKPPVPQPELIPLPEIPEPPKRLDPLAAALYIPAGLPRDALDAAFVTADRIPLLGAATSALYRYSGLAFLCRAGTGKDSTDALAAGRGFTYGQLAPTDPFPTFFPLISCARENPRGSSNYILQLSLGTLTIFDLLDATYSILDRVPLLGAATTTVTLPLNWAWRQVPDSRAAYTAELAPGGPEGHLTFGAIAAGKPWPLLPNARAWAFTAPTSGDKARTYADYARRYHEAAKANEKLLAEWLSQEEARRKYNDEAIKTLRQRNADLQRKFQQEFDAVRRDNEAALQRYHTERKEAEEHNLRAAALNALGQAVLDLPDALVPKPPRPALPPRPRPKPVQKAPATPPVAPPPKPAVGPAPAPQPAPEPAPKPKLPVGPRPKTLPRPPAEPVPAPKAEAPAPAPEPEVAE